MKEEKREKYKRKKEKECKTHLLKEKVKHSTSKDKSDKRKERVTDKGRRK